jgi:protein-serine/threonine kinase
MLDRDVERRIGIQAVLEHPWCTHVDEEEDVKVDLSVRKPA